MLDQGEFRDETSTREISIGLGTRVPPGRGQDIDFQSKPL